MSNPKTELDMVALPTTEDEFNEWASSIIKDYNLPDSEDTLDSLATSIMHLNQSIAFYPREYFRDIVLKALANRTAYDKLQTYAYNRKLKLEAKQAETLPTVSVVSNDSPTETA